MQTIPDYITYLRQPQLLAEVDRKELMDWVDSFPTIPVFRILLAAKCQLNGDSDTADKIEDAAFYVQDRRQLKRLLRNWQQLNSNPQVAPTTPETTPPQQVKSPVEEVNTTPEPEVLQTEVEPLTEEAPQKVEEKPEELISVSNSEPFGEKDLPPQGAPVIEEPIVEVPSDIETQVDELPAGIVITTPKPQTVIEVPESIEEISEEEKEQMVEESVPEETAVGITAQDDEEFLKAIHRYEAPRITPTDTWSKEWLLEAPGSGIPILKDMSWIDVSLVDVALDWLEEDYPSAENKTSHTVQTIKELQKNQIDEAIVAPSNKIQNQPQESSLETSATQKKHSFDEWLNILEKKKSNSEESPAFDLPVPEVFDKQEVQATKESTKPKSPRQKEEQPAIDEATVKQMAAESVSFKMSMATETLAKLYIKQGKIDQAIEVYKKLMIKYPKKSSYFAGQIEKLKA